MPASNEISKVFKINATKLPKYSCRLSSIFSATSGGLLDRVVRKHMIAAVIWDPIAATEITEKNMPMIELENDFNTVTSGTSPPEGGISQIRQTNPAPTSETI